MKLALMSLVLMTLLVLGECKWRGHRKEIMSKLEKIHAKRGPSSVPFHKGQKDRAHSRGRGHGRKHLTPSLHDDDDWLSLRDLKLNKDCTLECKKHEICIQHSKHGSMKCVSKHNLKEGRRLFKKFHQRKEHLKDDMNGGNEALKKALFTAENMRDVYDLLHEHQDMMKPVHVDVETKHNKPAHSSHKKDLSQEPNTSPHSSSGECAPHEMYEIRKRLAGWFVMLHSESRQHHHLENHHGNKHNVHHPKRLQHHESTDKILTETHGHCKCTKSAMWEFRKMDENRDHHLSHEETSRLEHNHNEPCLLPFIKSCDRDQDGQLSRSEWCCCMADVIAPCAEKAYNARLNHEDWSPRCDSEGFYERQQCQGESCWCVDLNGNEIKETRTAHGKAHCGKFGPKGEIIKM